MRWHKKSRLWVDGEIAIMSAGIFPSQLAARIWGGHGAEGL